MSAERLEEIRSAQLGNWYSEPWHEDYVVASGDEPAYNRVVCGNTTLATLPDFAGPIALWICDAHQAVPQLLAEVERLTALLEQSGALPVVEELEGCWRVRWSASLPEPRGRFFRTRAAADEWMAKLKAGEVR